MATHDYVIANGTGAAVRSDLNGALAAIVSQNSSATEPSPSYAYQRWADTTAGVMKMRNGANNAWITLYQLDGEWSTIAFENGTAAAPSIYFKDSGTDTGIYSPGANQVAISTNGTGRLFVDASGRVALGGTTVTDSNLLNIQGSTATDNVGVVLNKTNGTAQVWGIQNSGSLSFFNYTASSTALTIDTSGRLLVGTSNARANFFNTTITTALQVEGTGSNAGRGAVSIVNNDSSNNPPFLAFGRSGTASLNSNTLVANNDILGGVHYQGADGTDFVEAASITAQVDGTPGANDMPGRLVFSVTPDGGSSPTTSPSAMTINSGQEVLIGYSTDNGAYKLQVNSQIFATSATIATSDGRYKENVATLNDCVDLVKALRPVSFDWKHQEPITRINEEGEIVVVREAHNFPDGAQVGFIAQEVQEVLAEKPWLTSVIKQNIRPAINDSDGNELAPEEEFFGIAEGNLVAVLTSALKDAIGRIESLEAEVAALKA